MSAPMELLFEDGHLRLRVCRDGRFLYNVHDAYVGRSLDLYGEFSDAEAVIFRNFLGPGMVAVDIGANIGCHTVLMSRLVTETGSVLAVEPQRQVFQMLAANVSLNGRPNVHLMFSAAGAAPGMAKAPPVNYRTDGNFGGVSMERMESGAPGEPVPVITLDGLNLPGCHFIKIDVEGAEADVLDGAENTIRTFEPLIYAENDRPDKSARLLAKLLDSGHRVYWHTPALYNPNNFAGNAENVFGRAVSLNVLAIPKSRPINVEGLREVTRADDWPWSLE